MLVTSISFGPLRTRVPIWMVSLSKKIRYKKKKKKINKNKKNNKKRRRMREGKPNIRFGISLGGSSFLGVLRRSLSSAKNINKWNQDNQQKQEEDREYKEETQTHLSEGHTRFLEFHVFDLCVFRQEFEELHESSSNSH